MHDIMSDPTTPRGSARSAHALPYLPGLDGLRALAVSAVLIYHAGTFTDGEVADRGIQWLRGGYLGVEVFFVISGYLITSLLLLEQRRAHTNDIQAFWLRRARRLLAALYALLAFWTVYAVVFLRDEVARLRGDIVAGFFYVTNWYQISTSSYVDTTLELNGERPSLFKHLWSLAVEEQYYILWPVLFLVVFRVLGRDRMRRVVMVAALASAVWMAALTVFSWLPGHTEFDEAVDPTRIYEGTDTRAAGLLLGSWLAFVWAPNRIRGQVGRGAPLLLDAAGVVAAAWLFRLHQTVGFDEVFLYRGGLLLVSALTCVLIVVTVHPASHIGAFLGAPALRWIGVRSYGIYLWHWPIFQITRPELDMGLDGIANLVLRLTLTLVAAELSYRFIETPVRTGAALDALRRVRVDRGPGSIARRRKWSLVAAATALALVVSGTAVVAAEFPECDPDEDLTLCREFTVDPDAKPTFTAPTTVTTQAGQTVDPTEPGESTTSTTPAAPSRNVIAIGDSVMLGAADRLRETFPGAFVDATVSRSPVAGVARIEELAAAGGLANVDIVIIHLGTNGNWGGNDFDRMMETLADIPLVIAVNSRMPRSWEASVNAHVRAKAKQYANVRLLDWHKIGNSKQAIDDDWFAPDGFHLNASGRRAYAAALLNLVVTTGH
jgi:peptidoglycan/LPS O-acetylase OafA/YrhL